MIKGDAVLISEMTPSRGEERSFNRWYEKDAMPGNLASIPGLLSAMRYKSKAGPHYLAIYELASRAVADSEEYRRRISSPDAAIGEMTDRLSGRTSYLATEASVAIQPDGRRNPLDARVILCMFFNVPMERAGAFDHWFDSEYAPILLECGDWLMARQLDVIDWDPEPYSHIILHYLHSEAALKSGAFSQAGEAEAYRRLAAEQWFTPLSVTYHRRKKRVFKTA